MSDSGDVFKRKLPDGASAEAAFPPLPPGGPDVKLGCVLDADM